MTPLLRTAEARAGRRRALLAVLAMVSVGITGCASTPAPTEPQTAAGSTPGNAQTSAGERVVWEALAAEGAARWTEARDLWLSTLSRAGLPDDVARAAGARLLHLLDRVTWDDGVVSKVRATLAAGGAAGVAGARVLLRLAERRSDASLRLEAKQRLGEVSIGSPSGRLSPRLTLPASAGASAPDRRESRQGAQGFAVDGPGRYAGTLELPSGAWSLEVDTRDSVRVSVAGHDGGDARVVVEVDRSRQSAPRRWRVPVELASPTVARIDVATREETPTVRLALRPAGPVVQPLRWSAHVLAAVRLIVATDEHDSQAIDALSTRLATDTSPVVQWLRVQARFADPEFPAQSAASTGQRELTALLEATPSLAAARLLLVELLIEADQLALGESIAAGGALGEAAPWVASALATARGRATAAKQTSKALVERYPQSCEAWHRRLDVLSSQSVVVPDEVSGQLPGCPALQVRRADLALASWDLSDAERRYKGLSASTELPRGDRSRAWLGRAEVALASGGFAEATSYAERALELGVDRDLARDLLWRIAALSGDSERVAAVEASIRAAGRVGAELRRRVLDPAEDLGLPLLDGHALVQDAQRRGVGRRRTESYRVLLDDRHTHVFADGAMIQRVHRIVHILDAGAAEEFGELPLPAGAEVLVARTWKPVPGRRLQPIEPEEYADKGAISLPSLTAGSFAEAAWWWWQAADPRVAGGWRTPAMRFDSARGPTRLSRWTVRTPPGQDVVVQRSGDVKLEQGADGTRRFIARSLPRRMSEPNDPRPDRRHVAAGIARVMPDDAVLARVGDRLAPSLVVTPAVRALAVPLVDGLADQSVEAKAKRLFRFVLDEINDSDDGPDFKSAGFMAVSRTGERAVLLTAMCRAVGLRADLALARPRSYGERGTRLDVDTFVFPLVRLTLEDGDSLWLDTSSRFAAFGTAPPLVQGAPAIAVGADAQAAITRVEPHPERLGKRKVDVAIRVEHGGGFRASTTERVTGYFAMSWRHALAAMSPDARVRAAERVAKQTLPTGDVSVDSIEGLDDPAGDLIIKWHATGTARALLHGRRMLLLGLAPQQLARESVKLARRTTPMLLNRAANIELSVRLSLGADVELEHDVIPREVTHPQIRLRQSATVSDNRRELQVNKRFRLDLGVVAPSDYPAWVRAAQSVDQADVVQLVLRELR